MTRVCVPPVSAWPPSPTCSARPPRSVGTWRPKILADDRLSWTSFVAMWVLWVWGEMESRDLAAAVGISRPTSTGVVTTLEGRGYVRRSKTADDGRLVRVTLTDTGRSKIEELFPRFNAEEVALTTHLDEGEQEQLAALLRSMLRRVGNVGDRS